jgi:hypothetical protein
VPLPEKAKGRTPLRVLALSIRSFEDPDRHPDHNDLRFQFSKELLALRPRVLYPPSSLPSYEPSQFHPSASSFLNTLLSSVAGSPDFPSSALFYWKISPPLIWILARIDRSARASRTFCPWKWWIDCGKNAICSISRAKSRAKLRRSYRSSPRNRCKIFPSDLFILGLMAYRHPLYRHIETTSPPATISPPPTRTAGVGAVRKKM